jgi:hypothetical protein
MAAKPESKDRTKQVVCEPAIMQAPQMSSWNDKRLDELSRRTDEGFKEVRRQFEKVDQEFKAVRQEMKEGFARVDGEMKGGFAKVDQRFERIDERFHRLWGTLVFVSFGIIASIIATGILT